MLARLHKNASKIPKSERANSPPLTPQAEPTLLALNFGMIETSDSSV
jgi:hypothetical protein